MFERELAVTATAMIAPDKRIFAIVESSGGEIKKRFAAVGMESNVENRRADRELLISPQSFGQYKSAIIPYAGVVEQAMSAATSILSALQKGGTPASIKVHAGAQELACVPGKQMTEGLDGLQERLAGEEAAQKALFQRAKLNTAACFGRYKAEMEKEAAAA